MLGSSFLSMFYFVLLFSFFVLFLFYLFVLFFFLKKTKNKGHCSKYYNNSQERSITEHTCLPHFVLCFSRNLSTKIGRNFGEMEKQLKFSFSHIMVPLMEAVVLATRTKFNVTNLRE